MNDYSICVTCTPGPKIWSIIANYFPAHVWENKIVFSPFFTSITLLGNSFIHVHTCKIYSVCVNVWGVYTL